LAGFPAPGNISSDSRTTGVPLIYAVDDAPELTELYAAVLEADGYSVRTFNDRAEALAALGAGTVKPDLLITDCLGRSMPVDRFLRRCLVIHPALRILMASGLSHAGAPVAPLKPDRFIQKPFTLDELQQEVRAALIAS
jgi:DNA-binding NtrC family response regulator